MAVMPRMLLEKIMQNNARRMVILVLSIIVFCFVIWGLSVSNLGQSDEQRAAAALQKGLAFGNQGKYEKAIVYLNKSIEIDPKMSLTYYVRGYTYFEKKEYENAIRDFTEAFRISPTYTNSLIMRGICYSEKQEYEEAEKDFTLAIETHESTEAYNERGLIYIKTGKYDKAVSDFNKSIEINPRLAFPYQWRAVSYFNKKEYDKAWQDLHKAEDLANYKPDERFIANLKKTSGREK